MNGALSAITAAVVGVILNLAVWFSLNVLFADVNERFFGLLRLYVPNPASLDVVSLLIAAAAFVAIFRFRTGMFATLGGAAAAGLLVFLFN